MQPRNAFGILLLEATLPTRLPCCRRSLQRLAHGRIAGQSLELASNEKLLWEFFYLK